MNDVLRLVYDYRLLLSMQAEFNLPLDGEQRARLDALWSMLEGEDGRASRRVMVRFPYPARVSFSWPGGLSTADIVDLSGGGIALHAPVEVAEGTRVIVRVQAFDGAGEYVFPTRVVWAERGEPAKIGLAFDGAPSMLRPSSAPPLLRSAA